MQSAICREILAFEPANVSAAVLCAQAMAQRGDPWGAMKLLRDVLQRHPEFGAGSEYPGSAASPQWTDG